MTVTVKPVLDPTQPKDPAGPQVITTDPGSQAPMFRPAPEHPETPVIMNPQHPPQNIKGDAHGAAGNDPGTQAPRVDDSGLDRSDHAGPTVEPQVQPQRR